MSRWPIKRKISKRNSFSQETNKFLNKFSFRILIKADIDAESQTRHPVYLLNCRINLLDVSTLCLGTHIANSHILNLAIYRNIKIIYVGIYI